MVHFIPLEGGNLVQKITDSSRGSFSNIKGNIRFWHTQFRLPDTYLLFLFFKNNLIIVLCFAFICYLRCQWPFSLMIVFAFWSNSGKCHSFLPEATWSPQPNDGFPGQKNHCTSRQVQSLERKTRGKTTDKAIYSKCILSFIFWDTLSLRCNFPWIFLLALSFLTTPRKDCTC